MKRILITGANGQLGSELQHLTRGKKEFIFTDLNGGEQIKELDICSAKDVENFILRFGIVTIINCAAYTNVDKAEDEADLCMKINRDGAVNLAVLAKKHGASIVQISTDYVFDGKRKRGAYSENNICRPLSIYGKSKREAELAIRRIAPKGIIIRTAWLYSSYGNNFVKTMIRLGSEKEQVNVVSDQYGNPTYSLDLASAILKILPDIRDKKCEIFHYTNEGKCSWSEFASMIMLYAGLKCKIRPISTAEYPSKAQRPAYSILDKTKIRETFGVETPWWNVSLKECIEKLLNK